MNIYSLTAIYIKIFKYIRRTASNIIGLLNIYKGYNVSKNTTIPEKQTIYLLTPLYDKQKSNVIVSSYKVRHGAHIYDTEVHTNPSGVPYSPRGARASVCPRCFRVSLPEWGSR